jgi:hypothetical protein
MQKVITFKTNYNNKLGCKVFPHIDVAPATGIPESKLEERIIEIRTADNSHPPVKTKLINLLRLPLWQVSDALTYPSHGMDSTAFQEMMILNNDITPDKPMAVYFYEKIGA